MRKQAVLRQLPQWLTKVSVDYMEFGIPLRHGGLMNLTSFYLSRSVFKKVNHTLVIS